MGAVSRSGLTALVLITALHGAYRVGTWDLAAAPKPVSSLDVGERVPDGPMQVLSGDAGARVQAARPGGDLPADRCL